jgi:hypothetical protein
VAVQVTALLVSNVLLMCGMEDPKSGGLEGHSRGLPYMLCRAWSLFEGMFSLVASSFCQRVESREIFTKLPVTCAHAPSLGVWSL